MTQQQDESELTAEEVERLARAGFSTHDHLWQRDKVIPEIERIIAAREAKARYFAMWHFFLTLPFGPFSDLVQREATRLRALCPTPTDPSTRPASTPCCPGAGSMAHVRGCVNHPEADHG